MLRKAPTFGGTEEPGARVPSTVRLSSGIWMDRLLLLMSGEASLNVMGIENTFAGLPTL